MLKFRIQNRPVPPFGGGDVTAVTGGSVASFSTRSFSTSASGSTFSDEELTSWA